MIILTLLMILVMSTGFFTYNSAIGAVNTEQLDAVELQTFNSPIEQYEGTQSGAEVKTLISNLIANAGVNSYSNERLPDITYRDTAFAGPKFAISGTTYSIDTYNSEFTINSDVNNNEVTSMSELRGKISQAHTYNIEVEYDDSTGLIDNIIINY